MIDIVNSIKNLKKKKSGSIVIVIERKIGDKMINKVMLSPSILNVDKFKLHSYLSEIDSYTSYIHIDVMDGIFVPNKTDGIAMYKEVKRIEKKPLDVHLMVVDPIDEIDNYKDAGIITFHVETIINPSNMRINLLEFDKIVKKIKSYGAKVGIAIKPRTTISLLINLLDKVDNILVMTVEPGYGGQKLIPSTLDKINSLRKMGYKGIIEVDGGITTENAKEVIDRGANLIVAGTAIFGATDIKEAASKIVGE